MRAGANVGAARAAGGLVCSLHRRRRVGRADRAPRDRLCDARGHARARADKASFGALAGRRNRSRRRRVSYARPLGPRGAERFAGQNRFGRGGQRVSSLGPNQVGTMRVAPQFFSASGTCRSLGRASRTTTRSTRGAAVEPRGRQVQVTIEGITKTAHYKALHRDYSKKRPLYVDLYSTGATRALSSATLREVEGLTESLDGRSRPTTRASRAGFVTKLSRPRRYAAIRGRDRGDGAVYTAPTKRNTATPSAVRYPRAAAVAVAKDSARGDSIRLRRRSSTRARAPPAGQAWTKEEPRAWKTGLDALGRGSESGMVALAKKRGAACTSSRTACCTSACARRRGHAPLRRDGARAT